MPFDFPPGEHAVIGVVVKKKEAQRHGGQGGLMLNLTIIVIY
jgi:hypothetical protein